MNCRKVRSSLADLLLDPLSASADARQHVETCADCRRELEELRATVRLMDEWPVAEANPFFDAKLLARVRAEQQAPAAGFLERSKAWFLYGSRLRMRPLLAGALALAIMAAGGTYADLEWRNMQQIQQESATVRDLQSLDGNAEVFQQLDSIDQSADQPNQDPGGAASPTSD